MTCGDGWEQAARYVHECYVGASKLGAFPIDDARNETLSITGTFRINFNRHAAAPLVWSIATDTFELAVADFTITTPLRQVYRPKATPDDEDGKPSAWLETTVTLTMSEDGHAKIG